MESYRHNESREYFAVLYKNNKTGKINLVHNSGSADFIRNYWANCENGYSILEMVEIKNKSALLFNIFWNTMPKNCKTKSKKFDFFKYVLGADLNEKYRGIDNVKELEG